MKLLFRMTPQGAFYGGDQFADTFQSPFCKSDTIFKAVLKAWELLWGNKETQTLVERYLKAQSEEDIPFYLSSIFPVIGDVYFLPRPFSFRMADENLPPEMVQEISWISAGLYRNWLEGNDVPWSSDCHVSPGLYFHPRESTAVNVLLPQRIPWAGDERTRNEVDLVTSATRPYQSGQIYYAENLEHYLLAETRGEYQGKLEAVFRLLAHEGIGGKRSAGCGGYLYRPPLPIPDSLDFVQKEVDASFVTLSLYYPLAEDIENGLLRNAKFQLIDRQGWHVDGKGSAQQQPGVRLCKEGSHFHAAKISTKCLLEMTGAPSQCYHYVHPFRVVARGVSA